MTDATPLLSQVRRPRLLISAALFGLQDYRRERDLRRLVKSAGDAMPETVLPRLLSEEERMEANRKAGDASYSFARHIEILIALLAEARLLPRRTGAV